VWRVVAASSLLFAAAALGAPGAAAESIWLDPGAGPPGTTVRISGDLLGCYETGPGPLSASWGLPNTITFYWDPGGIGNADASQVGGMQQLGSWSLGQPAIDVSFTVPADARLGSHLVVAELQPKCNYQYLDQSGNVVASNEPSYTSAVFCVLAEEGAPCVEAPSGDGDEGGSGSEGGGGGSDGGGGLGAAGLAGLAALGLVIVVGAPRIVRATRRRGGSPPAIAEPGPAAEEPAPFDELKELRKQLATQRQRLVDDIEELQNRLVRCQERHATVERGLTEQRRSLQDLKQQLDKLNSDLMWLGTGVSAVLGWASTAALAQALRGIVARCLWQSSMLTNMAAFATPQAAVALEQSAASATAMATVARTAAQAVESGGKLVGIGGGVATGQPVSMWFGQLTNAAQDHFDAAQAAVNNISRMEASMRTLCDEIRRQLEKRLTDLEAMDTGGTTTGTSR
jgi:hypothetical protein